MQTLPLKLTRSPSFHFTDILTRVFFLATGLFAEEFSAILKVCEIGDVFHSDAFLLTCSAITTHTVFTCQASWRLKSSQVSLLSCRPSLPTFLSHSSFLGVTQQLTVTLILIRAFYSWLTHLLLPTHSHLSSSFNFSLNCHCPTNWRFTSENRNGLFLEVIKLLLNKSSADFFWVFHVRFFPLFYWHSFSSFICLCIFPDLIQIDWFLGYVFVIYFVRQNKS